MMRPDPRDRPVIGTEFARTMDPDDPNNGGAGRKSIRCHVSLSDTPAWAVARMTTLAEWRGWTPIAAIQLECNPLEGASEEELFGAPASSGWA